MVFSTVLCSVAGGMRAGETCDYPIVTLLPHLEASLEQLGIAEPVRRLLVLRHADFVPRVIFVRGVPIGCAQVGQRSAGGGAYRRWIRDRVSSRSWRRMFRFEGRKGRRASQEGDGFVNVGVPFGPAPSSNLAGCQRRGGWIAGGSSDVETKSVIGSRELRQGPSARRRRGGAWRRVGLCICHIRPAEKIVGGRLGVFEGFVLQCLEAL